MNDKHILRELAKEVAEIAALPQQEEKRRLWRNLNKLSPSRPMVMIDQICWNELNHDGSLDLICKNDDCRNFEQTLRRQLYQWKHFPVDMVVESYITVPKAVIDTGNGLDVKETMLAGDKSNDVVSHHYENILNDDSDVEKIKNPQISEDKDETTRRVDFAKEIFDDILQVKAVGVAPFMQLWDPISAYMGIQGALDTIIDRPDFMHKIVEKLMESFTSMLDQVEAQGLLLDANAQALIHCTGAYTDELPKEDYDPNKPRLKDLWTAGLAQMFSIVSPAMHQEYELDYVNPIFERFGLVYYGCCEPLDHKLDIVKKIPNLRKVSMSPWTDRNRGAEGLGSDYVFSCKPNPAHLAYDSFDEDIVRKELKDIYDACKDNNTPLEFILKDISTIRYDSMRLQKWANIAMEISER